MSTLLVALPVCHKDIDLVLRNLQRCTHLDGRTPHHAIVFYDGVLTEDRANEVISKAEQYFAVVHRVRFSPYQGVANWPYPQNFAWQSAARHIEHICLESTTKNPFGTAKGWLWWEADAVPLRTGWLDVLSQKYATSSKPFMGHIVEGTAHMNGVAVYPFLISNHVTSALLIKASPFDVVLSKELVGKNKIFTANQCLLHDMKEAGGTRPSAISTKEIDKLPETAVLFHGRFHSDDPEPVVVVQNRFYISGDLGDVIYALPTMRAMGGGALYIGPEETHMKKCREPITEGRFNNIAGLLRLQPYLSEVVYTPKYLHDTITHDLNQFRQYYMAGFDLSKSLATAILEWFKQPKTECDRSWLTVDKTDFRFPVIVNRSFRYHADKFPWKKILKQYANHVGFIGLAIEHADFCNRFGFIPYIQTTTLLDAARVIAGCKLFIGNQSSCYSIAEGLKHNTIQETWDTSPNCVFERANAMYFRKGETLTLPDITSERMSHNRLVFHGPMDGFSGYGQAIAEFVRQMTQLKYKTYLQPTATDETMAGIPSHLKDAVLTKVAGPRLVFHTHDAFPGLVKSGDAVFTMWESTRIKPESVQVLNDMTRGLIVPNVWNASCFSAAGVNVPIKLVPLGIDPVVYFYREAKEKSKLVVFGTAGRFAHGGSRKGLEEVVAAFTEAFPSESNVRLHVKLFQDCAIKEASDPRIVYTRQFLSAEGLAEWYSELTVFVSASKGEGWGLHHLQSMAVGRAIMCAPIGGVCEFFDSAVGYPLEFDLKECDGFYMGAGIWGVPRQQSLIDQMRHVYKNKAEAVQLGIKSAQRAKNFTWESASKKLETALISFGMI